MKAVIPTGGRGTRMQPLTFSTNKHFIPVANKPLIFYPIETIADAGIKDICITYNPGWLDYVKNILGTGSKWGLKFTYVLQPEPKGLANIFQVCEEALVGSKFVLHLGDNIFADGIKDLVNEFEENKLDGLITMVKVRKGENSRMGVPRLGKNNSLKEYVEKPANPFNDYGIPGLYFFNEKVFECFKGGDKIKPSGRGELEISAPYNWLVKHGFAVEAKEYTGKWMDPGKFGDWIESNQYLLDKNLDDNLNTNIGLNTKIEGRVQVGKKSKISNSEIRGPVAIGDNVVITNSYIGPFTSISDDCNILRSHVENSVLMQGVIIKNIKQPINESLIGANAEVVDEDGPTDWLKLFIGEKSRVKI